MTLVHTFYVIAGSKKFFSVFDWKICSLSQFLPSHMYLREARDEAKWTNIPVDEFNKYIDELKKLRPGFVYVTFCFYRFFFPTWDLIGYFQYLWIFLECNYLCNGFSFSYSYRCQMIYYFKFFILKLRYFFVMFFKLLNLSEN